MERSQKTNYQAKLPLAVDVDQVEVLDVAGLYVFSITRLMTDGHERNNHHHPFECG